MKLTEKEPLSAFCSPLQQFERLCAFFSHLEVETIKVVEQKGLKEKLGNALLNTLLMEILFYLSNNFISLKKLNYFQGCDYQCKSRKAI